MTQEEKDLLIRDLCARLPYGIMVECSIECGESIDIVLNASHIDELVNNSLIVKPYLRPLSTMTEEEKEELLNLLFDKEAKYFYIDEEGFIDGKTSDLMKDGLNYPSFCPINVVLYTDWLNAHHFDYRSLIEKGLAIEAPEGMYN